MYNFYLLIDFLNLVIYNIYFKKYRIFINGFYEFINLYFKFCRYVIFNVIIDN